MPSLTFPIEKSFYKKDNLFKHDFLIRQSLDTVDLLWYRTHDEIQCDSDRRLHILDENDLLKINRTVETCPDNELEIMFEVVLHQLLELQSETEVFDFYYEFHYVNSDEVIKDDLLLQRRNDIVRGLRIIETDELLSDYVKFWDYIYEKSAIKTIISPEVWDENSASYTQKSKRDEKNKQLSDVSDFSVMKAKDDLKPLKHDSSLMNARFLLQQLKDKGLDEDCLTFVNVFADGDEEENVEAEFSSSGTLSTEVEPSTMEPSGSILTEISFEVDSSAVESDSGMKDPFKDKSFDSLYYIARLICNQLLISSNKYFDQAPIILLENDLVLEMKDREGNYLTYYNRMMNRYLVKIEDKDGVEGYNSRLFRLGLKKMIDELTINIEKCKHEGIATIKSIKKFADITFAIQKAPTVGTSDYSKLVQFDMKTEEVKGLGQKRKIKQFKTMVCLAGRTKLRRYDYSEKITGELNKIKFPIQKLGQQTKTAQEHVTTTVNGYLATLLKLTKSKKFYEDYPSDMYDRMKDAIKRTTTVLNDLKQLKHEYEEVKSKLNERAFYKPFGSVRRYGETAGLLDSITSKTMQKMNVFDNDNETIEAKTRCFTPGLNIIMTKKNKAFYKTALPSEFENDSPIAMQLDVFESQGHPQFHNDYEREC